MIAQDSPRVKAFFHLFLGYLRIDFLGGFFYNRSVFFPGKFLFRASLSQLKRKRKTEEEKMENINQENMEAPETGVDKLFHLNCI